MYCVNCGVKLADTEQVCPLCQTRVYHPDIERPTVSPLYPQNRFPRRRRASRLPQVFVTVLLLIVAGILFLCDNQFDRRIVWSPIAAGGLLLIYLWAVLPSWFRRPNPIVFVPCDVAATIGYLWLIDWCIDGGWFMSFAFPVAGGIGAIVITVVVLMTTLRHGKLFVLGGACVAFGAFMLLVEFLLTATFPLRFIGWSFYPLVAFGAIGGLLIIIGACRPLRETMERKFFL